MADAKISALALAPALTGAEMLPAVAGGATVRMTVAQIATFLQPSAYLGQVATRALIPERINAAYKQANGQTLHVARDDIASVQVAFANWYSDATTHEAGTGGAASFTAAIQYPIGAAWQPFLWGGVAGTGVVADGATSALSDTLALASAIPRGAAFLMRRYDQYAAAVAYRYHPNSQVSGYDAYEYAASGLADKTISGAAITNVAGVVHGPCLIVAQTRRASVYLFGDSRIFGHSDVPDGGGDTGEAARAVGPHFAYINHGTISEKLTDWLAASSRRRAMAAYCSHAIGNGSINDLTASRTSAQLLADIASGVALFPGKPVFWNTIAASAASSDAYVTIANQTPSAASNANRLIVNRGLRAGVVAGLAGVFDTANTIESAPESGRYAIGNGGQALTADGLHLNALGYATMRAARAVETGRIVR